MDIQFYGPMFDCYYTIYVENVALAYSHIEDGKISDWAGSISRIICDLAFAGF